MLQCSDGGRYSQAQLYKFLGLRKHRAGLGCELLEDGNHILKGADRSSLACIP